MPWYHGNMHCHTSNSDGSHEPNEVAYYYQEIGMDFLAITDHNHLTPLEGYGDVIDKHFIGIPSCEYSGEKNCHVVAFDVAKSVGPQTDQTNWSLEQILQDGVRQTREAGGVPILCHPCWEWTYDHNTILKIDDVTHFEVCNMHPACNGRVVPGFSGGEAIWDKVLSSGKRCFGTVSDDAHFYGAASETGVPPIHIPLGGTGWNVIQASKLSRDSIRKEFEKGHFYGTTGLQIDYYCVSTDGIHLGIKLWKDEKTVVDFIGKDGKLLDRQKGPEARYLFQGDETYIRVRLADSTGSFAFTQPVFLNALDEAINWTENAG